ncbi:MAG: DUF1292 domain-containing protein [Candidatus Zophobacter franzmannii]|jgi:hypothetical protein|nr:DUF1292 domain-containing protein [Candidatus Zophobacter franzmannii]
MSEEIKCESGCDHDHTEEELNEQFFIDMELDDGSMVKCEVLGTIEIEKIDYIAVLPEKGESFWVYRFTEHEDSLEFINISDEAEFKKVVDTFEEVLNEEDGDFFEKEEDEEDKEEKK